MSKIKFFLIACLVVPSTIYASESVIGWYNFKKGEYIYHERMPDDMTDYLPQNSSVIGLYNVYIATGKSQADAYIKVMETLEEVRKRASSDE